MTSYVVDDAAVVAGLGAGNESQRRELSRLVHDALNGGPSLHVPALCLAAAASVRPTIADHFALLATHAVVGAIDVPGLAAGQLADMVADHPGLGFAAAHAASEAILQGSMIVTTDAERYAGVPVLVGEL
jgi:hypothetical protein